MEPEEDGVGLAKDGVGPAEDGVESAEDGVEPEEDGLGTEKKEKRKKKETGTPQAPAARSDPTPSDLEIPDFFVIFAFRPGHTPFFRADGTFLLRHGKKVQTKVLFLQLKVLFLKTEVLFL